MLLKKETKIKSNQMNKIYKTGVDFNELQCISLFIEQQR